MEYFYVYMLRCFDGTFYVGHTDNIDRRIAEHKQGIGSSYTKKKLPIELVYVELCSSRSEALVTEHKIKKWSCIKKEALIKNNWDLLKTVCKKNFNH
jgi:predicted GIY-YIG superfamily endonuclease